MRNLRKKVSYTLYFVLAVVCPMCWEQLGIRFMQNVGKKGKGSYQIIKFENGDKLILEDINKQFLNNC